MKKPVVLSACMVVLSLMPLLSLSCSETEKITGPEPFVYPDLPDNVFFKAVDPDHIVDVSTDTIPNRIIDNELMIAVDTTVLTATGVATAVASVGGSVVGQVPYFGIYQIEFSVTTLSELDSIRTLLTAVTGVAIVAHNALANRRSLGNYCDRNDDNSKLPIARKFCFEDITYFATVPIMGKVRETMNIGKVRIGIFDSGLNPLTGQFDNIRTINMTHPGQPIYELDTADGHGTRVTGVIAADNNDGGVNGIASRVLENNLDIAFVYDSITLASQAYYIFMGAFYYDIDVWNMSFGYGGPTPSALFTDGRPIHELMFAMTPNVLYCAAAGNSQYLLTGTNDTPAGIQLPNVITVGGTSHNSGDSAWTKSSYGPFIDIAAPAEELSCVNPWVPGAVEVSWGNSFATPMVTSCAAIMKSIDPSLTPSEIKTIIKDWCSPTAISIGGRRLNIAYAIEKTLIDLPAPKAILDIVDLDTVLGEPDPPGLAYHRICGGTQVSISHFGTLYFKTDTMQASNINDYGLQAFLVDSPYSISLGSYDFHFIDTTTPFVNYQPEIGEHAAVFALLVADGTMSGADAVSGELVVEKATITQRALYDNPLTVEIEGRMSADLEMIIDGVLSSGTMDGRFKMIMAVLINTPEVIEYLETKCIGGKLYTGT